MPATDPHDQRDRVENVDLDAVKNILEGALLAAAGPVNLDQMQALFGGEEAPEKATLRRALERLERDCAERAVELVEVASGFRLQVRQELQPWVSKLFQEKPQRYSRALLETLALIAYRQPITRGEIEDVRGVSVSTNIVRTLEEREWVRIVGYRDVPGKPALYGTTRAFLDYFGLKSLDDLPSLAEIRDFGELEPQLDFGGGDGQSPSDGSGEDRSGSAPRAEADEAVGDDAEAPPPARDRQEASDAAGHAEATPEAGREPADEADAQEAEDGTDQGTRRDGTAASVGRR